MKVNRAVMLTVLAGVVVLSAGCDEADVTRTPMQPISVNHALTQLDSCDAFEQVAKESAKQRMRAMVEHECSYLLSSVNDRGKEIPIYAADADDDVGAESGADFSQTNTQEAGVDEADLVKTDGNYIYTVSGRDIVIVAVEEDGKLSESGRMTLDGRPAEMFLKDDMIVVFSRLSAADVPESIVPPTRPADTDYGMSEPDIAVDPAYGYYDDAFTGVDVIDVSDKAAPALLRTAAYAGRYVSSRRIDGAVRAVISSSLSNLEVRTWIDVDYWDMDEYEAKRAINRACDALLAKNAATIDALTLDELLPKKYDGTTDRVAPIAECTDIYAPTTPAGIGLLTVVTLDLTKPAEPQTDIAVMGEQGQVYASTAALYLTTASDYVLTAWESGLWEEETTGVYKFDITGTASRAEYSASGSIDGRMLNQFSLGEYEGYLRAATTTGSAWWGEDNTLDNHITVLEQNGDKLNAVGKLNGLGADEEVYAARFMGTRGFVVTFFQSDPLFTLDLSDPKEPKLVGLWEGPGYSTYLHPFGENLLVAMGKDENRRTVVSLYDLSDFSNPALVERQPLVGVNYESAAVYEHKAFTFNAETGDLLLPFYDWNYDTGVLLYKVAETGISLTGTMPMGGTISVEGPARRAMYNGNVVIGVGGCRITSASLEDPSQILSSIPIYDDACEFPNWYY